MARVRVRERNKRVRAEHQQRLADHLLDHPCVDCGEADLRVLDLDHEDPAHNAENVGRLVTSSLPWSTVLTEIEKRSVGCANCHRRRTAEAFGWWRAAAEARRRQELQGLAATRLSRVLGARRSRRVTAARPVSR